MAKYDYGGGCPCGLYRECIPQCEYHDSNMEAARLQAREWKARVYGKEKKMKDTDDFGFTMVGEDEVLAKAPTDDRAERLRDMITPLLNNLKKNPDKDYIQWHGIDRVKQIDSFIARMNKLVDR